MLLPKISDAIPAVIGPAAHPIPNTVSYAPTVVPTKCFGTCFVAIFSVIGKYRLKAKPNITSDNENEPKVVTE